MTAELTHIVHVGWPITFTLRFPSFKSQLAALRALIDLALLSPREAPPHFVFVSSISAGGRLPPSPSSSRHVIPESPLDNPSHTLPHGYALAKYAAEKILQAASLHGLKISIVRSGQISGSLVTGAWNSKEFMPSILRASTRIGKVPVDLRAQSLYWLPVDNAAQILHAISQASYPSTSALTFYGLENVAPLSWDSVLSTMLLLQPSLHTIPAHEWVAAVRAHDEGKAEDDSVLINSSLLNYIEEFVCQKPLPKLATDNTEAISKTVADLIKFDYARNQDMLDKYIGYVCDGHMAAEGNGE